jgi:uncharacterized protein YkwD
VRLTHHLRLAVPAAAVFGLALFSATLAWQAAPVSASSGSLDNQANELVRLINGARSASGKGSLSIDVFLASKARDGAIPCPDDSTKSISGRSKDMAENGGLSHDLRNCDSSGLSSVLFVKVLQSAWGYGSVGEILLDNGGYGNGAYLYSVTGSKKTWMSWTYSTTGHAMTGWKSSSSHWNIIMGSYSHVGCGGWASGSTYFYDCLFSKGGPTPSGLKSPPTKSPFSNPLPATPAPKPAAKSATSGSGNTGGSSGSACPTCSASPSPTATVAPAWATPLGSADPLAGSLALAGSGTNGSNQSRQTDGGNLLSTLGGWAPRALAGVAGSGVAIAAGCLLFISFRRRRRAPAR